MTELEKVVARYQRAMPKKASPITVPDEIGDVRFSAVRLRKLREKLGVSAPKMGLLLGVSPHTVYNWERQVSRPSKKQVALISAIRKLRKRAVVERLDQLAASGR